MDLGEYVSRNTKRGECKCGQCCDRLDLPDLENHTVDMVLFKVAVTGEAKLEELKSLINEHKGEWTDDDITPLDGKEHSYIELGAWLGSQGLALQFMALGHALGLFDLLTPKTVFPPGTLPENQMMEMAASGLLTIKVK